MGEAIRDLKEFLTSFTLADNGKYVYVAVDEVPDGIFPLAIIREAEGIGIVIPIQCAEKAGFEIKEIFTCLTLNAHSALTMVGLTALVSGTLAAAEIPCNVIAGYYHDHLLIPSEKAVYAKQLLSDLAL